MCSLSCTWRKMCRIVQSNIIVWQITFRFSTWIFATNSKISGTTYVLCFWKERVYNVISAFLILFHQSKIKILFTSYTISDSVKAGRCWLLGSCSSGWSQLWNFYYLILALRVGCRSCLRRGERENNFFYRKSPPFFSESGLLGGSLANQPRAICLIKLKRTRYFQIIISQLKQCEKTEQKQSMIKRN